MKTPVRLTWDEACARARRNAARLRRSYYACETRYGYSFVTDTLVESTPPHDVVRFQRFDAEVVA